MKLGVSAFAWTGKFEEAHLSLLPTIKSKGFEVLEIPMSDPGQLAVTAIRRSFASNELECTVCALLPSTFNPISPNPEVRKKSLLHLKQCVETSAELGAKMLGGPLYAPIGYLPRHRPRRDEQMWAVEAFQGLGDLLDANDMKLFDRTSESIGVLFPENCQGSKNSVRVYRPSSDWSDDRHFPRQY